MQKIDGTTIKLNRGDELNINLTIKKDDGSDYVFQVGDIISFAIYKQKDLNGKALLLKEIEISSETSNVEISLTNDETKLGNIINQPMDYWYEIELNNKYTVIGYDEDGAKIIRLYPEGGKLQ